MQMITRVSIYVILSSKVFEGKHRKGSACHYCSLCELGNRETCACIRKRNLSKYVADL